MTSQMLTQTRPTLSEPQAVVHPSQSQISSVEASTTRPSGSVAVLESAKLPYQVDHQVELLHLRAEVEALLQQLQSLKQQRLVSVHQSADL